MNTLRNPFKAKTAIIVPVALVAGAAAVVSSALTVVMAKGMTGYRTKKVTTRKPEPETGGFGTAIRWPQSVRINRGSGHTSDVRGFGSCRNYQRMPSEQIRDSWVGDANAR